MAEESDMEIYVSYERGGYKIEWYLPKELKRPLLVTVKAFKNDSLLKTIEVELPNTPQYPSELTDNVPDGLRGRWLWPSFDVEKLEDKIEEMIESLG